MRNRTISLLVSAVFPALFLTGCSLALDFNECESDGDCASGQCVENLCVEQSTLEGCTTNEECGEGLACRQDECVPSCESNSACEGDNTYCLEDACQTIDVQACPRLSPVFEDDVNIIPVGALLPLSGPNGSKGQGTVDGAELAFSEINGAGGVGAYRFGLIACDTESEAEVAVSAADHLSTELGVESIIGSGTSGETIAVAQNVTIENDVLLISPAATSPAISDLPDDDLVWRTIASDTLQGPALGQVALDQSPTRIAVLFADSTYGRGLFELVTDYLKNNGFPTTDDSRLFTANYQVEGGALAPDTISGIGADLFGDGAGFDPDVIMILGSSEGEQIINAFESTFDLANTDSPPTWVLTEAGKQEGLLDARFKNVWSRIEGTSIQQTEGPIYQAFQLNYTATYQKDPKDFPFADKAYDAGYLIGYAYAAIGDPLETTGPALADQLVDMSSGPQAKPGANNFNAGVSALKQNGSIDYQGASGNVDFNNATGDVQSDIEAWAIVDEGDGTADFQSAGELEP